MDKSTILLVKTEHNATIGMLSSVVANGNHIFKEITLNFINNLWSLKVRGQQINLSNLGIVNTFKTTYLGLKQILYITEKIKICIGLDIEDKKKIPIHIIHEKICVTPNEISMNKMSCSSCTGILGWLSAGDACYNCRMLLNKFKNSDQSNEINLNETDERDLDKILDTLFPQASPEMKSFLQTQYEVLKEKSVKRRRWNKNIIQVCLSLWSRSPRLIET